MTSLFDAFLKYRVSDVHTVSEFIDRYYKPERIQNMLRDYPDYRELLIASYEKDVRDDGYTIISHHDSRTGECVSFYPAK